MLNQCEDELGGEEHNVKKIKLRQKIDAQCNVGMPVTVLCSPVEKIIILNSSGYN